MFLSGSENSLNYFLYIILSLSTMGKSKNKKKWTDNFDKHFGENSNDKGMALKNN